MSRCPTCGCRVSVVSGGEETAHYAPAEVGNDLVEAFYRGMRSVGRPRDEADYEEAVREGLDAVLMVLFSDEKEAVWTQ